MRKHLAAKISGTLLLFILFNSHVARAQNIDIDWLRSIHNDRNTSLDGFMNGISKSVYPVAAAVPITQLVYGYSSHDAASIRNGWTNVAGLGITFALTFSLKYTINRDRPYVNHPDIIPGTNDRSPSFPSGHTSTAFSTATSLSLQYPKWYVITPAYLWAGTVGYSRLHLGQHYPSDVLTGAIIGVGSSYLSYKLNRWLERKHQPIPVAP